MNGLELAAWESFMQLYTTNPSQVLKYLQFIICLNLLDFHGSVFLSPIFNDLVHFLLYIFTLFKIILRELLIILLLFFKDILIILLFHLFLI